MDELHAITSAIKQVQGDRDVVLALFDNGANEPHDRRTMYVTRAEAERIFADRISAHEAKLAELGWKRTVRVDSVPIGGRGGGSAGDGGGYIKLPEGASTS